MAEPEHFDKKAGVHIITKYNVHIKEKGDENIKKLYSNIQKNRTRITCGTIIASVMIIMLLPYILNDFNMDSAFMDDAAKMAQIVSSFFVITGVIVGVWQYYITTKSHNANISRGRIEKAIKLSEYYKDNVLPLYAAIDFIFKQSGASPLLKSANLSKVKNFNEKELKKVYTEKTINSIKSINSSEKLAKCILLAEKVYCLNLTLPESCEENAGNLVPEQICDNDRILIINRFASDVVSKALNNLEYFAMNFTHGVADESVVYQSLAPTYINIVELLYYNIAYGNKTDIAVNYYTNVTELYRIWKARQNDQQETIDENNAIPVSKGNVLEG